MANREELRRLLLTAGRHRLRLLHHRESLGELSQRVLAQVDQIARANPPVAADKFPVQELGLCLASVDLDPLLAAGMTTVADIAPLSVKEFAAIPGLDAPARQLWLAKERILLAHRRFPLSLFRAPAAEELMAELRQLLFLRIYPDYRDVVDRELVELGEQVAAARAVMGRWGRLAGRADRRRAADTAAHWRDRFPAGGFAPLTRFTPDMELIDADPWTGAEVGGCLRILVDLLAPAEAVRAGGPQGAQQHGAPGRNGSVNVPDRIPARLGPYRLVRALGQGSFGTTYLGENRDWLQVAVKALLPRHLEDPKNRSTLEQEVRADERLSSRYFARVLNHDLQAEQPWVAYEFVPGTTLSKVIEASGRLEPSRVAGLAQQLANALADLGRFGIVHFDLKPDNIMVGDSDAVSVLDLGMSWLPGRSASGGARVYMPPEVIRGGSKPNPAVDIWSLGLVLAVALTGSHPVVDAAERRPGFRTDPWGTIAAVIVEGSLDLDGVPTQWRPLLQSMTDLDPDQRPNPAEVRRRVPRAGTVVGDRGSEQAWVDALAALLRASLQRGWTISMPFGDDDYVQWIRNDAEHMQLEMKCAEHGPEPRHFIPAQSEAMRSLGFEPPISGHTENWWMLVGDAQGFVRPRTAAEAVIRAALEVYGTPWEVFSNDVGDSLELYARDPQQWQRRARGL